MGPAGRNGHLDVLKYLTDRKGRIPEGTWTESIITVTRKSAWFVFTDF